MLNRKRKTKDPCEMCFMHRDLCLCDSIPHLQTQTRVCVIVHHRELKRTSNTGRLVTKALFNSEMRIRGERGNTLDLSDLLVPEYRTVLFYPCESAIELSQDFVAQDSRPIQLIVPDGNWRQASKVHYRHDELAQIPRVMIATPNTATRHLRAEHRENGMSTLEAVAKALGIIEGPAVQEPLMSLYQLKLQRTLFSRGFKAEAPLDSLEVLGVGPDC